MKCSMCDSEVTGSIAAHMGGFTICPQCSCLVLTLANQTSRHASALLSSALAAASASLDAMRDADEDYSDVVSRRLRHIDCTDTPEDQAAMLRAMCKK